MPVVLFINTVGPLFSTHGRRVSFVHVIEFLRKKYHTVLILSILDKYMTWWIIISQIFMTYMDSTRSKILP